MRSVCLMFLLLSVASYAAAEPQPMQLQPSPVGPAGTVSDTKAEPESDAKNIPISIDAGEPFGLSLTGGVDRYRFGGEPQEIRKVRIEWGMQQSVVSDMLKPPAGSRAFEAHKGLSCLPQKNGAASCFPNVAAPWSADFGESFQWAMDPYLSFTPDGKFFAYSILFHVNAFEDTKRALLTRLGKPRSAKTSTVENRMGAKFDQETMEWETAHTRVFLLQRTPSDLTKGLLEVAYTPLEKALPPEPTAPAPF